MSRVHRDEKEVQEELEEATAVWRVKVKCSGQNWAKVSKAEVCER
jgi:hypothetical protein